MTFDGPPRELPVHVPWALRLHPDGVPMVFAVHGSGGCGRGFRAESGRKDVAEREGCIVAASGTRRRAMQRRAPAAFRAVVGDPSRARRAEAMARRGRTRAELGRLEEGSREIAAALAGSELMLDTTTLRWP